MIVEADNITLLVQRVQGFLDGGWVPTGGLVVITTRHDYTGDVKNKYAQALTRPKPVDLSQRRGSVTIKL